MPIVYMYLRAMHADMLQDKLFESSNRIILVPIKHLSVSIQDLAYTHPAFHGLSRVNNRSSPAKV
jgi:hypothetical protein